MLSLLHKKSPFLVLAALLMPDCGAWLYFHPQNTHSFIRLPVNAGSAAKSEACDNTARCWGSTSLRKASADVERPGRRRRRLFCTQPSNDDGPRDEQVRPETRSPPTEDVSSTVVSTVFARLHKPVGLVLAEVEPGKPGLMVDEIVDGGSAEQCGIVEPGMALVSALGVDCTKLRFDEVAEMLQESPLDAPIEFEFHDVGSP